VGATSVAFLSVLTVAISDIIASSRVAIIIFVFQPIMLRDFNMDGDRFLH